MEKKNMLEKQKEQHHKEINFIPPHLKFPNMHFTTTSHHLIKKAEPGIYFIKYLGIS